MIKRILTDTTDICLRRNTYAFHIWWELQDLYCCWVINLQKAIHSTAKMIKLSIFNKKFM